jgi:hypothetical protein
MTENNTSNQNILRATALTTLFVGTIGSLYFMLKVGSNQKSIILVVLFTVWVMSPFVGLFVATLLNKLQSGIINSRYYLTMIVLSIVSLIAYSGILTPTQTKPAFTFLVVPFLSWLIILTIIFITKRQNLKQQQ